MSMASWGLIANAVGAVMIGIGQSEVTRVIRLWLMALQVTVQSQGSTVVIGSDTHMDNAIGRDRWLAGAGWLVMIGGYVLQLISK
jgi:hypothetical protein